MTTVHSPTAAVDPFRHEGLVYQDTADYLAGTVPFVQAAVDADEPALVAVPAGNLALIRDELGASAEKVRFADMTKAGRNPFRIIPWVLNAFINEHAGRPVRIIGEPIWAGRTADEYPVCVQHEALINHAFTGRDATILCPYDARRLEPSVLADAERTHPIMVDRNGVRTSSAYAGAAPVVADFNRPLAEPTSAVASLIFDHRLSSVRGFVTDCATAAGLGHERIADLLIAANEIATNAITHGQVPGQLRCWSQGGNLVCEISDRGQITDLLGGRTPPGPDSDHGRGLLLAYYLCDLVQIHSDAAGTTIRLHMAVESAVGAA